MTDRDQLAQSLRATVSNLKHGYAQAKAEGRIYDSTLIAGMRISTEYALRMLTDTFWNQSPKTRQFTGYPKKAQLSERQEAMLDAAAAPLTETERRMLWLCGGYGASVEAAGIAMRLSEAEATDVFESMVVKVKQVQRQVLGVKVARGIETSPLGGVEECDAGRPGRGDAGRPGAGPQGQGTTRTPRLHHRPARVDRLGADDVPGLPDGGHVGDEPPRRRPFLV